MPGLHHYYKLQASF